MHNTYLKTKKERKIKTNKNKTRNKFKKRKQEKTLEQVKIVNRKKSNLLKVKK